MKGLQRSPVPCTYALLLTAFHPPRVHMHTHPGELWLSVSVHSVALDTHQFEFRMPTAAGRLLFSQHAPLTKFFFFPYFKTFQESVGEKWVFFTLEQLLGSENKPSVSYGMSEQGELQSDCKIVMNLTTHGHAEVKRNRKLFLLCTSSPQKWQLHLRQTTCLTFHFPFSACLSPSLLIIREKTSDFHIMACYCHHIFRFMPAQKKEADKMHFQCLHLPPKYTSSNHTNTQ